MLKTKYAVSSAVSSAVSPAVSPANHLISPEANHLTSFVVNPTLTPILTPVSTFLSKDGKLTTHKDSGLALGISSAVIFLIAFGFMYGFSIYALRINEKEKAGEICFPVISMSSAFMHTHKAFPTILIIIFLLLMQFYYNQQNIFEFGNENDAIRILCVVATYFLVISWLMLFYIFYNQIGLHSMVAFMVLLVTTMMSYTMYKLYERDYQEQGLERIKACAYMSIIVSCLLIVVAVFKILIMPIKVDPLKPLNKVQQFMSNMVSKLLKAAPKLPYCVDFTFNSLEFLNLVVFFVFLIICSTLPPLIKQENITCVLTG